MYQPASWDVAFDVLGEGPSEGRGGGHIDRTGYCIPLLWALKAGGNVMTSIGRLSDTLGTKLRILSGHGWKDLSRETERVSAFPSLITTIEVDLNVPHCSCYSA